MVSADPVTIGKFSLALEEFSLSPDVCTGMLASIRLLNRRKFEAVIIDLQLGEQAGLILDEVHRSSSNRTAVTFAISGSDEEGASFRKRWDFFFERFFSMQSSESTLKPAYGLILRERRRYFRCAASVPVIVIRTNMPEVRCHSVNISEGGMALSTFVPLNTGECVQVQFTLPGQRVPFVVESNICWLKSGCLGVRFVSLLPEHKSELQGWLSRKLEESLPESVACQFRKAETFALASLASTKQG